MSDMMILLREVTTRTALLARAFLIRQRVTGPEGRSCGFSGIKRLEPAA